MYYNTSSNLTAFSTPQKLLDAGFDVIDGTIVKEGYHYSIILKDERQPMEEYSQLFLGTSETDYLHFDHFSSPITTRHQCEGPFVIQRQEDTLVYYDDYTRHQFLALYSLGVYDQGFVDLDMSSFSNRLQSSGTGCQREISSFPCYKGFINHAAGKPLPHAENRGR